MTTRTDSFHILYSDPSEEDDMNDTAEDPWCAPLGSTQFVDRLQGLLDGDFTDEEAFPHVRTSTFDAAGVMTSNDGLVVTLSDGSEYQITVVRSR